MLKSLAVFAGALTLARAQYPINDLQAGQVFGLVTLNSSYDDVHDHILSVYGDGTLGTHDPYNPEAPDFRGVLMPEFGVVLQPEPLQCLKFSDRNIFLINDSLWNTGTGFTVNNARLTPNGDVRTVICPTWNHVLLLDDGKAPLCEQAIAVELEVVTYPIP